jgi:hypothetical protein
MSAESTVGAIWNGGNADRLTRLAAELGSLLEFDARTSLMLLAKFTRMKVQTARFSSDPLRIYIILPAIYRPQYPVYTHSSSLKPHTHAYYHHYTPPLPHIQALNFAAVEVTFGITLAAPVEIAALIIDW